MLTRNGISGDKGTARLDRATLLGNRVHILALLALAVFNTRQLVKGIKRG